MAGSSARLWNVGDTVSAVTPAPKGRASAMPCLRAFCDSSDPSVAIRMCLYMTLPSLGPALGPDQWDECYFLEILVLVFVLVGPDHADKTLPTLGLAHRHDQPPPARELA